MNIKLTSAICAICLMATICQAQSTFSSNSNCIIRIQTDSYEYEFSSDKMSARLNTRLQQFEFEIPVGSVVSIKDLQDLEFLNGLVNDNPTITINATLPNDRDEAFDLSYFKGNKSMKLDATISMGNNKFLQSIEFKGMLMGNNQSMAYRFDSFVNTRNLPKTLEVSQEKILEIEFSAKGDKIIGLTGN